MKFYKEIDIAEHLLYAKEILQMYPIVSSTGKIHLSAMTAMLNSIDKDKIYFNARHGLKRVYSRAVYLTAVNSFEEAFKGGTSCEIEIQDKKYKIHKIGGE